MLTTTYKPHTSDAFQLPQQEQRILHEQMNAELERALRVSGETQQLQEPLDQIDLTRDESNTALFQAETALTDAQNQAISSKPETSVNRVLPSEILRYTTEVGTQLAAWRIFQVKEQSNEFIDTIRSRQ